VGDALASSRRLRDVDQAAMIAAEARTSGAVPGLILAAAASGSGKTTLTLGLLRALRDRGYRVQPCKVGPDFIDPMAHGIAGGVLSSNLDPWAMRATTRDDLISGGAGFDLCLVEGVMGLFDGGPGGVGSTAALAQETGWPVVAVIDAAGTAQTAAAVLWGLRSFRPAGGAQPGPRRNDSAVPARLDAPGRGGPMPMPAGGVNVAGVIFNRVGGARHVALLREAMAGPPLSGQVAVLGFLPRDAGIGLPDRHLGLVPAGEVMDIEARIARMGALVADTVDLEALLRLATPHRPLSFSGAARVGASPAPAPAPGLSSASPSSARPSSAGPSSASPSSVGAAPLLPLGQRVALGVDAAFPFVYPHLVDAWRKAGVTLIPFSPLADQAPDPAADAVFLPGGYPELHAGALAAAGRFLAGLRAAAARGAAVYGECGGYMVLGAGLEAGDGTRHAMAGLLPVETSFAADRRRLHLGYRRAVLCGSGPLGDRGGVWRGHEFHYAAEFARDPAFPSLFALEDVAGSPLGPAGCVRGSVCGSFVHVIDRED